MTEAEFAELAKAGYTRIPVLDEARADLYTPLAVYVKLAGGPYSYLLESAQGGERFGRYSFIGLTCSERIETAAQPRGTPPGRRKTPPSAAWACRRFSSACVSR